MNKITPILILIFILLITACSGNASNSADPASGTQNGPAAGELSSAMQVAIGTIKLDETDNAVTADQAAELLPLWQTLQVLYTSDTAADQEIDSLITQIQETMTDRQTQAISALNLTRQDMMSIMQEQGIAMGGAQNGNTPNGGTSANNAGGFRPEGGGFSGPPPDGGIPGGGQNFQGQGTRPQSTDSTSDNTRPAIDPNRIPMPLVQAIIDYLKTKSGS